jgi:hypothetical protein
MSLHGKEKIWFLINRLQDERDITAAGQPVALHPAQELNNHYLPMDLINLADKLEKEKNAVKLLNTMPTDQTYGKYLFELLPDWDSSNACERSGEAFLIQIQDQEYPIDP